MVQTNNYWLILQHIQTLFMTSLVHPAGHKMTVLTVVFASH